MTYSMVSIVKKMVRGKPYYYARECRRVDGKPKIVWQKYLGKADDIVAALSQPQAVSAVSAVVTDFGAVAALFDLAQRLRLVEHIDRHIPACRGPSGPSVGTYLLVAALNRCVEPRSKAQIASWFDRTVGRRLLDLRPGQLTSQRFWNQMDRVSAEAIVAIERDLTTYLVGEFALPVLSYRFREEAWQQLQAERLGKTILFTDQDEWSDAQIVRGYRSQHHVEDAFRDMKDTEHLALRPQRHWTDQKIRVHVFYCVLALTLCGLLRRELHNKGIARSLVAILEDLGQIKEVCLAYAPAGEAAPQFQVTLTQMTEDQQALYDTLDLGRYRSQ